MKTASKMKMTSKMKATSKVKMTSKMKTTSKKKTSLKKEGKLKTEADLKIEDNLKNWPLPQKHSPPPLPLKNYLKVFVTSHCDSHTATDVKPEMILGL